MKVEIIILDTESLKMLLLQNKLLLNWKLNSNINYLFFHENKVYGIYTVVQKTKDAILFKHNGYQNAHYIPSKAKLNVKTALYLIRQQNKPQTQTSLIIKKNNDTLHVTWHSKFNPELISAESINIDSHIERLLFFYETLKNIKRTPAIDNQLKDNGQYLYNQLPENCKHCIENSNFITLKGNFATLFYKLHNHEGFLTQRKRISEHQLPFQHSTISKPQSYRLVFNTHQADPFMEREYQKIQKEFQTFQIPLSINKSLLTKPELSKYMEQTELFHYIGHLNPTGIPLNDEEHFSLKDFQNLSTVPTICIFSACHGLSEDIQKIYFQKGGQLLLFFDEVIDSSAMDEVFRSFYWQFFSRRIPIEEIVLSLRRQLYKRNLNWLHLRAIGKTRLRYNPNPT